MATETNFQESVCLKNGEREEHVLTSESFEEKVTELPSNKVKQLETSSQVAETVNTPLETGDQPTAESGIFFQALSVPVVIADEHSNTPESYKAAKQTEPEEEIEGKSVEAQEASEKSEIRSKDIEEQKSEESVKKIEQDEEIRPDVGIEKQEQNGLLQAIPSDACISTQTKSQVEITEHEQKDEDEEKEQYVNALEKDQDDDDITSAQEATFGGDLQEKNHHTEDDVHEVVEAKGGIEEDTDVFVSTQTELVNESIKNEEPDDEKAIEKEVCEENGPKKAALEGGLEIYDSVAPGKEETLSMLEKDQSDSEVVTTSQEAPCMDVEETTSVQHVTTAIDFKEQDLKEKPKEFIEEETEDKSLDAQEASKEFEKGAKEAIEQDHEKSVKKIEKEEESVTAGVCVSTETKSQVEKTEHEEEEKSDSPSIKEVCDETGSEKDVHEKEVKDSEIAIINKDEEKEQEVNVVEKDEGGDDVPSAQDVTVEKDLQEKNHHNEDDESEVVTVEGSTEKDTEGIRSSEKTEEQMLINSIPSDVCISPQPEPDEEADDKSVDAQKETEQHDDGANGEIEQKLEESVDETAHSYSINEREEFTEEIKPSVETIEEKDVCISTPVESQEEATKNEEPTIENDGDRKDKQDNPFVKEVCEENDLKTESEEQVQLSDSSIVKTRESVDADTEETKSSDDTKANEEQQGLLHVITTDICSPTQTEYQQKTTESEENNNEETIENDGQTEKPESPMVEVVCEATSSEVAESEEGVKHSDSFSTTLNENETLNKEEKLEKEHQIKTAEVQGGGDDVTSSQNASNEDIKETAIGQLDTTVAYVEEGQGVSAMPKDILIEEAENKSIDAEEMSLELGQPNEQGVEETHNLTKTTSENPEDEIKKEDTDLYLSHDSVEDTNDDTTKEEKSTIEQEPVEEHSGRDEVLIEKVTDLNETTEVEPQEDITPPTLLETSTKDTSNLEKEKAESEILPIEDLETVSEVQVPELVPKSEESVLKEECLIPETETHLNEEKETVTKEISSDEKTVVQGVGDDVTSSQNASSEDKQETTIDQHDTTAAYVEEGQGVSATHKEILIEEAEDKSIDAEEMSLELGQHKEQNVEETHILSKTVSENPEDEIKNEDKDASHESVEDTNDDTTKEEKCTLEQESVEEHSGRDEVSKEKVTDSDETTEVEPQEDITPPTLLETSTEDTSNSEKEKAEMENLPIEDLETVTEVQIPELVPKSEESVLKEKCFVSKTETHLDEENRTISEETSSEETTEIKQETVKEVCEETSSEKAEFEEGLKFSGSSDVKINKEGITTFKDDDQDKDHEVNMSAESQGKDDITSSLTEVSEEKEDLQENNFHDEGNEGDFIKRGEGVDEDTEEIKSSVETKENTEHVITTNVCSSTQIQPGEETIKNEEKNGETAIKNDDNEIVSREETLEKKQEDVEETKMDEHATILASFEEGESLGTMTKEVLGEQEEKGDKSVVAEEETEQYDGANNKREQKPEEHTDEIKTSVEPNKEKDVSISTQIESQEDASKNEEHATESKEINHEEIIENDGQTEKPENPLVEVLCEATSSEMTESEEGVKHSDSVDTTLDENETLRKEETLEKEHKTEKSEVQGSGDDVTSSQNASSEDIKETTIGKHDTTVAFVEEEQGVSAMPKEILIEEAEDKSIDAEKMSLELGQPNEQKVEETHSLSETTSQNPEEEIKKENKDLSHESVDDTNDNTIKKKKCTLEQEPVEEHSGRDEVPKEKVTNLNEKTDVDLQEDITPSTSLESSTEDASNLEKEQSQSQNLPIEDLETVPEVKIPELVPKSDESVLKEEILISERETQVDEEKETVTEEILIDEKREQTTKIKQETVKEVCEVTSSEKAEFEEGLKLSDSSDMKINEEGITFKDDDQEKDQEVNISAESQGEENITSSQHEVSEEKEDLQEMNHQNEGNENDFIKSGEGVDEDNEQIKSSVETKEDTEHVITTNVCTSAQIEPNEETIENEEKNDKKAIENDENEMVSREDDLKNEQVDVCSSAQTEPKEETIYNDETNEKAIDNDEGQMNLENLEKEQEHEISELQGGGDDVISSQNTSNEDTKETAIDQHANTVVQFEEGLGVNAISKEIIDEEVDDKSVHVQEASEQSENRAEDEIEQQPEESVNKPLNSCSETSDGGSKEEEETEAVAVTKEIEPELEAENQADKTEDRSEMKDEAVLTEKVTKELGQIKEQNVEEIQACLTETVEEQHDSQDEVLKEKFTDLSEATAVEPQEDVTPFGSLGTSTENTTNSDKTKEESENLPIEHLESVPEVIPKSEDSKMKEECLISATATYVDEENGTVTKEISCDENLETHGSTQQPDNSYSTTEENVTQLEQIGEINSLHENRAIKEDVTQESQLNSIEDCSEMVKDVILTEELAQVPLEIEKEKGINDFKEQIVEEDSYSPELEEKSAQNQKEIVHEISNSDSIPVENPEVTEVNVDAQIGQEDLQGKEHIRFVSEVTNEVDQEPKEERIPSIEDSTAVESPVDLSNIESTAYPAKDSNEPQALESDCDVQIPEVVADSEDSKSEHTYDNNVEEQDTKTNEISSATDKEQENVTKAPTKIDEAKSSDLIIEEKALTKEDLEIHGEIRPTSQSMIEDQVSIEMNPQPAQSDITSENIKNDQTLESKLEHTSRKNLEAGKEDNEEDVTLAPENEIKSIENQNKTTKNIILTDEVAVKTEKENERNEIGQVSQDNICLTELENRSTPNQKELATEIEYSKPIPVGNTEVTELKDVKDEKSGNEAVEDVIINKVLLEDEEAKESKSIKDIINEEAKLNQLTSDTDEVCQIESSRPDKLLETKDSVEDIEEPEFMADNLNVKDETFTVVKGPNEDNEIIASEFEKLENMVTEENIMKVDADKEKVTPDEPQADDSAKTTYDSVMSSIEQDVVTRSEESRGHGDMLKFEEKPTEDPEIATKVAEDKTLLAQNDKNTEDPEVLPSVEKDVVEGVNKRIEEALVIDFQKHEKDLDHETEVRIADVVSNVECSKTEPPHLDAKEATSEVINQENQREQEKEADESTEAVIPIEDVKTSTRELEAGSVNLEVPSVMDATADKANNKTVEVPELIYDQSKPIEEGSGMKQEPLEVDAPGTLGTAATADLKNSQKYVKDDLIKVSQTPPEIQKYEVPACTVDKQHSPSEPHPKESTESKILTEKIDSSHEQGEPIAKSLITEEANLRDNKASGTEPERSNIDFIDQKEKSESVEPAKFKMADVMHEPAKGNSEVAENLIGERDLDLTKDHQVEKEEIGESGVKTDEEDDEDNEDDEKMGSGSDAPVMVEASKDMDVKVHKKSHNILSGVGSKVKHSISKVKKAITGKSSPPKTPSPKAKNQVIG